MSDKAIKVVLCWHMHQPQYYEPMGDSYHLPWTYLHALKDYVDMVMHLESVPDARAVVNFTPTLLEQLDDYTQQIGQFLESGNPIRDPLLYALANPVLPAEISHRIELIQACLRANEQRMIARFPAYQKLTEFAQWLIAHVDHMEYVSDHLLTDLLVWYHIVWFGETVHKNEQWLSDLIERGSRFTIQDRKRILIRMHELIRGIVPRYRALAESGRIELSVTPYAHPIIPLLLDFNSARQSQEDIHLPPMESYPGGEQRAHWHLEHALTVFKSHFGFQPNGCWPAEGGVCDQTLGLLEQGGFKWAATGENVLRNSLNKNPPEGVEDLNCIHHPFRLENGNMACFFRDDGLSDLIGFQYSDWHADDAVANLIHHIEEIGEACKRDPNRVISIILDGENAWEYFPENGYYFLNALYRTLVEHPKIELTTFSDCLDNGVSATPIHHLVAGSWVYGTFSTWIGHLDKNRAWEMLVEAKQVFDRSMEQGQFNQEQRQAIEQQLAICEGSDWFWWFGDDNPSESVSDFDHLFRLQLAHLYQLLGVSPPEYLAHTFSHGGGSAVRGGVMRTGSADVR